MSEAALKLARQIEDRADLLVAQLLIGLTPLASQPQLQAMIIGAAAHNLLRYQIEYERKGK